MELLAQFNPPARNGAADDDGVVMMILFVYFGMMAVSFVIGIFFLLTLSKVLKQVSPRNRKMEPGQVWLNLIPFFNYVWLILTMIRIADSLQNEYESRGLRGDGDFGKTLGIIFYVSLFVCGCISPVLGIMYWMKVAGFGRELESSQGLDHDSGERRRSGDEEW